MQLKKTNYLFKRYSHFFKNEDMILFGMFDSELTHLKANGCLKKVLLNTSTLQSNLKHSIFKKIKTILRCAICMVLSQKNLNGNYLQIIKKDSFFYLIKFENKIYLNCQLRNITSLDYNSNLVIFLINLKSKTNLFAKKINYLKQTNRL